MTKKSSIEQAIDDYRNGKMVIVVDDEGKFIGTLSDGDIRNVIIRVGMIL